MTESKMFRVLPILLTVLTGCTIVDSSSIPVGQQQRPQTSPSQVRIYLSPPKQYEELALISAKAGHDFKSDQSVMNSAMQRLREEAAKVGANGVLMQNVQGRSEPTVTTGFGTATAYGSGGVTTASGTSIGVSHGDGYNKVSGTAIYVYEDSSGATDAAIAPVNPPELVSPELQTYVVKFEQVLRDNGFVIATQRAPENFDWRLTLGPNATAVTITAELLQNGKALVVSPIRNTKILKAVFKDSAIEGTIPLVEQKFSEDLARYVASIGAGGSNGSAASRASGPAKPIDQTNDVYTQLLRLDELRQKGVITQQEFDEQKKILLGN